MRAGVPASMVVLKDVQPPVVLDQLLLQRLVPGVDLNLVVALRPVSVEPKPGRGCTPARRRSGK